MPYSKKGGGPEWSPPKTFDEYRVLWTLGRGGMGEVYLGHDMLLDRAVAIKFISSIEPDILTREQFLTEARAAARLQHPNVLTVYRVGEIQGRPFIISEYVRGQNLEHEKRPMPWQRVLELGIGLARGLAAAHRRGVLHRDIKPGKGSPGARSYESFRTGIKGVPRARTSVGFYEARQGKAARDPAGGQAI